MSEKNIILLIGKKRVRPTIQRKDYWIVTGYPFRVDETQCTITLSKENPNPVFRCN